MRFVAVLFTLAVFAFAFTGCGKGEKEAEAKRVADSTRVADSIKKVADEAEAQRLAQEAMPKTIAEEAMKNADVSTLVAALQAAELVDVFKGSDAYTVFAPTNAAFAAVQKNVDMLLKPENKSKLQNVLKYHVVAGSIKAADLTDGQKVKTLQGEELTVSVKDGKVTINGAEVTTADAPASNGVIHIINKVVMPKKM
jgi:uncharacterized surface protein with fasciclin (FAS1) repeats